MAMITVGRYRGYLNDIGVVLVTLPGKVSHLSEVIALGAGGLLSEDLKSVQ